MARYLIELTHGDERNACIRALKAIENAGSHFVTHADWGCADGTHCGWMIVEVDSRDDALQVIPPEFRKEARVVQLNHFSREQITTLMAELDD